MEIGTDGAVLTFDAIDKRHGETWFRIGYREADFGGRVEVSSFMVGTPALLFRQLASFDSPWTGTYDWSDFEGRAKLVAGCDAMGHVTILVTLADPVRAMRLEAPLMVEFGQLSAIARQAETLFS